MVSDNKIKLKSEMEMEKSQKAWKWGPGLAMPYRESGGKAPCTWRLFLNLKTLFPGTFSCFKQPLTKYSLLCCKAFFQRNKPGLDKGQYPKTQVYTSNKGCTHNHLSFWSYVLVSVGRSSCQQLTNDSIQKRKANLVIVTAPGNKISKANNE